VKATPNDRRRLDGRRQWRSVACRIYRTRSVIGTSAVSSAATVRCRSSTIRSRARTTSSTAPTAMTTTSRHAATAAGDSLEPVRRRLLSTAIYSYTVHTSVNAAKTRNPLKFAGVPPKLPNRSQPLVSPTELCGGAEMAIFGVIFASCFSSEPHAADFRPTS